MDKHACMLYGSRNARRDTGLIIDSVYFLTLIYSFYELYLPYYSSVPKLRLIILNNV